MLALRMADHYFAATPSSPSQPSAVELRLADMQMTLMTDRGVFSGNRVDPGTLTLLRESATPPVEGDLLDLGCGYGPVACALARRSPGATIWATDVNSRALELTERQRRRPGTGECQDCAPRRCPGGDGLFGHLVQSPYPGRQGRSARTSVRLDGAPGPRGQYLACRQPAPRQRFPGGLADRPGMGRAPSGVQIRLPGPRGDQVLMGRRR